LRASTGTVHELRAFWHFQFWGVAFQVVASGGGDGARGAEDARARNGAFFYGLFYFDIAVAGAFGF